MKGNDMVEKLENPTGELNDGEPIGEGFESLADNPSLLVEDIDKAQFMARSIAQDMNTAINEKELAKTVAVHQTDPDHEIVYSNLDPSTKYDTFKLAREKAGVNESASEAGASKEIAAMEKRGEEIKFTPRELLAHAKKITEEAYAKADKAGKRYEALQSFLAEFEES